jgi:hypothetical protein
MQEEQSYVGDKQQGITTSEDRQSQGTATEERSSTLFHEDSNREAHEPQIDIKESWETARDRGVQIETLQAYEERSKLRGIMVWLYFLLLNVYLTIFERILLKVKDIWKFGKERKMHVLQIYECQSEQCKYDKEEVDKEKSAQDIADSPEETMEHRRIQEDKDKFLEVEEEYTPQRPEEQKVVCTSSEEDNDVNYDQQMIKEQTITEDKCTNKAISYTFATDNNELSEDGETRQAKDEVMDLFFQISFNEHEQMITVKELRIVLRNSPGSDNSMSQGDGGMNRKIVEMKRQLKMLVQGRKAKEKSKEEVSEFNQYSEQKEDKTNFSKTGKYEAEERHDKIIMSCTHQQDENQKRALERMKGKINVKYNMIPDFKFLTVECILQDEGQNALGNMFACADIDKHGRFKDGNSHPSLQEQEDGRKQQDGSEDWSGERRVFITLTQGIAEEKEDCRRCEVAEHEKIMSSIQERLKDQEISGKLMQMSTT